jgi:hypothetical protein
MMGHCFEVNTSVKTVRHQCTCWSVLLFLHFDSHFTVLTCSSYDATWLPGLHSHHVWLISLLKSSTPPLALSFTYRILYASFIFQSFTPPIIHYNTFFFTNITNLELPITSFSNNLFLAPLFHNLLCSTDLCNVSNINVSK